MIEKQRHPTWLCLLRPFHTLGLNPGWLKEHRPWILAYSLQMEFAGSWWIDTFGGSILGGALFRKVLRISMYTALDIFGAFHFTCTFWVQGLSEKCSWYFTVTVGININCPTIPNSVLSIWTQPDTSIWTQPDPSIWTHSDTWLAGQPAGQIFQKKVLPGSFQPARPAALSFEKYGQPAGQPTMSLGSPIHFWGILLVLVCYWISLLWVSWIERWSCLRFWYRCTLLIILAQAQVCSRVGPYQSGKLNLGPGSAGARPWMHCIPGGRCFFPPPFAGVGCRPWLWVAALGVSLLASRRMALWVPCSVRFCLLPASAGLRRWATVCLRGAKQTNKTSPSLFHLVHAFELY